MTAQTRNYIIRRIILLVPLMFGLSLVMFAIVHLAPGDPAYAYASEGSLDPQNLARIHQQLGLDRPLPVQYVIWIKHVVRFDFGTAYTFNRKPVSSLIAEHIGKTVELQLVAIVLALGVSLPLGVISARRQYSVFDNAATTGAFLGLALPDFWLALLLQLFLAVRLGWLPASTPGQDAQGLHKAAYFVMPAIVLAIPAIAIFTRFMRSSMLEVINQDYVTTARAKGLADRSVFYGHALKNALIPMVTVLGNQLPRLLSGSVIVETIFAWPGLGWLGYTAILQRDYPVILALTLLTGGAVLIINVLVDVLYAFIDPRVAFD